MVSLKRVILLGVVGFIGAATDSRACWYVGESDHTPIRREHFPPEPGAYRMRLTVLEVHKKIDRYSCQGLAGTYCATVLVEESERADLIGKRLLAIAPSGCAFSGFGSGQAGFALGRLEDPAPWNDSAPEALFLYSATPMHEETVYVLPSHLIWGRGWDIKEK